MSKPRLSYATKQAIIAEYKSGVPGRVIAQKYGVDASYPSRLLSRSKSRKTTIKYEPKVIA